MSLDGEDAARRGTVVNSRPTTAEASCSWCPPASSPPGPAQHTTQTLVTLHHHQTTASPPWPAQHTTQTLVTCYHQHHQLHRGLHNIHPRHLSAQPTTWTLVTHHHHATPSPLESAQPTTWTFVTHHQVTPSPPESAQPTTKTLITHHQTSASPPESAQPTTT